MSTQPLRALILDDSPVLLRQLQQQLQQLGLHAAPLDAAVATQAGQRLQADVIFVELLQTAGNGFRLLRALARSQACPLVLLTGTGRASDRHWGLHAGAAAVLRRPVELAALRNCLHELGLACGTVADAAVSGSATCT